MKTNMKAVSFKRLAWLTSAFALLAICLQLQAQISTDPPVPVNLPPTVSLVYPTATNFTEPADIGLVAEAVDQDGWIATVEFYANDVRLAVITNTATTSGGGGNSGYQNHYYFLWRQVHAGTYNLRAVATDNAGASASSAVKTVVVNPAQPPPPPPPPTNYPPSIVLKVQGSNFMAPANIVLNAQAYDRDGRVVSVEYFNGDASIGVVTAPVTTDSNGTTQISWMLVWSNVPAGTYTLTARATDNQGATAISPAVTVVVQPPFTVVRIAAVDAEAAEPGENTGKFVISRDGWLEGELTVNLGIGGTASNGVDYVALPDSVVIPAGQHAVELVVTPIDDTIPESTETVTVKILPPICPMIYPPPPTCYRIGNQDAATVYIRDNDFQTTNYPPLVAIVHPAWGARFVAPANINITAAAKDADGITQVEFFANNQSLGVVTNPLPILDPVQLDGANSAGIMPAPLYGLLWSNVPVGEYTLLAKAWDTKGAVGVSQPIRIAVVSNTPPPPPPPPPTNYEGVSITAIDACAREGTNHEGRINTALFRVRRHGGDTNTALTVPYTISGTASNGVDYETLPGVVTIPPGSRYADILVVPIDDNLREGPETVILSLVVPNPIEPVVAVTTGANSERDAGFHANTAVAAWRLRAAAVILDNDIPEPTTRPLPDGTINVRLPTNYTGCVRIELSTNLVNWVIIGTNNLSAAQNYVDPAADTHVRKFYRFVPVPCPATEP